MAARYEELQRLLGDPAVTADPARVRAYGQELSDLEELVQKYQRYRESEAELANAREMLAGADAEMQAFLREEIGSLEHRESVLSEELRRLILPRDPRDAKNVYIEIRAGAGGAEAALFATDLFRVHWRAAWKRDW